MSEQKLKKELFIEALAEYLTSNVAHKSIALQAGMREGIEWGKLRGKTPIFGYPSHEEAVEILTEFLR